MNDLTPTAYANPADFEVAVRPLFDERGRIIDSDIGRAVVRTDTDEVIATCGSNFAPVQHMDVINPVLGTLDSLGYDIYPRAPGKRDLYDLKGRKGAFVDIKVDNGGATMRTDIVVGDFILPTGSAAYLPKGEDTMFRRFTLLNAHNGYYATTSLMSYMRLVCLNGMADKSWTAGIRARHTIGLDVDALRQRIAAGVNLSENDAERFGLYARTRVNEEQAREFFKKTIAKLTGQDENGDARFSARLVDDLIVRFKREDQTAWGLWNAMTSWATHAERRANASVIGTSLSREQRVARAMSDKRFDALLAA